MNRVPDCVALKLCHLLCLLHTVARVPHVSLHMWVISLSCHCLPAHLHASSSSHASFIQCLCSFTVYPHVSRYSCAVSSYFFISRPPTLTSLFYLFHRGREPAPIPCPCELNRSMEIDLLKYLLWNLLCDDNSRPISMSNWEEKSPPILTFLLEKEKNPPH